MSTRLRRYPRALVALFASTVVLDTGFAIFWPLVTLYVHSRLGLPMSWAGVVLLVQSVANLCGNLIGGPLFDGWGGRRTVLTGAFGAAAAAFGMALAHGLAAYLALTVLLGLGTGLIFPAINAFAAEVWPEGGRAAFNAVYVAANVGVALGSTAGGLLAEVRFSLAFAVTGAIVLAYALWAVIGLRGPAFARRAPAPRPARQDEGAGAPRGGTGGPWLLTLAPWLLALGLFLDWVAYVQWQTTIAVHMQVLGMPLWRYSLLWTVNGAVILLGQPLLALLTRRVPSVRTQIVAGNLLFILSFLTLLEARGYAAFVAGMVLSTFGEMLVWPGVPAAADRLAPGGRRGLYQGLVSGAASAGRAVGPLFGGILYDRCPTPVLFLAMAGVFAAGLVVLALHDGPPRLGRRHPRPVSSAAR